MATNRPRYTVSVDDELFQRIEDFRYEHRYQTRSQATVELIRLGLEALKKEQTEKMTHLPTIEEKSLEIAFIQ